MKIIIGNSDKIVELNGVLARIWEGHTDIISPQMHDPEVNAQFEREPREARPALRDNQPSSGIAFKQQKYARRGSSQTGKLRGKCNVTTYQTNLQRRPRLSLPGIKAAPPATIWTRRKGKSTCERDPAAGPGTCGHWWDGCPKANKRGRYLLHAREQDESQEVSR